MNKYLSVFNLFSHRSGFSPTNLLHFKIYKSLYILLIPIFVGLKPDLLIKLKNFSNDYPQNQFLFFLIFLDMLKQVIGWVKAQPIKKLKKIQTIFPKINFSFFLIFLIIGRALARQNNYVYIFKISYLIDYVK